MKKSLSTNMIGLRVGDRFCFRGLSGVYRCTRCSNDFIFYRNLKTGSISRMSRSQAVTIPIYLSL